MSSLLGDIDVASAAEIVFPTVPLGPRHAIVTDVDVKSSKKDETDKFLVIEFTDMESKLTISKWLGLPKGNPANWSDEIIPDAHENFNTERKRMEANRSNLKQALVEGLGIPVDRVNSVTKEDLMDLEAIITVRKQKNNADYVEIGSIKPVGNSGVTMPTAAPLQQKATLPQVPSVPGGSPFAPKA